MQAHNFNSSITITCTTASHLINSTLPLTPLIAKPNPFVPRVTTTSLMLLRLEGAMEKSMVIHSYNMFQAMGNTTGHSENNT